MTINTLQTIVLAVASIADPTLTAQATISLTPNVSTPATPTQVSLSSVFNRAAIYTDGTAFSQTGGFDLHGNAYSATLLGNSVTFQGLTFTLGPSNANDAVAKATITLPAGQFGTLTMLATGINGNQASQTFTVTYTDGTTSVFTQSLSDWRTIQSYSGETPAATMSYRNKYDKTKDSRTFYLYGYSFTLNKAKTVKNIILPANANVAVLALALVPPPPAPTPSVSPATVTLNPSQTQQFTASNLGTNPVWSLSPNTGTITSGGLYTSPSTVTAQTTITVKATSATDATQAATATLTLNPAASQTPPPPPTTITLPVEVIGPDGFVISVPFNLPSSSSLSGLSLYLQVHGLRYQGQASFQLNSAGWLPINDTTMTYLGLGGVYGGIGGGFNTLKMTTPVPASSLHSGANTISFRFNGTDGVSSGYRVLAFNLQDSSGMQLISSSNFVQTDPNSWQPPSTKASDISAGQTLWQSAPLTVPTSTGAKAILARCSDCHAQDGRDLKYFNYSNTSIQTRAAFHGLTAQQGIQIASYIRSINVNNPGRPWNPPYQPGPGMDSQPVANWAAGAGLDAVLESDAEMQPYIMPGGSTAGWAANQYLNPRETPIAFQLRDWNNWLPQIHPKDAFGASFTSQQIYTQYQKLRGELIPNNAGNYGSYLGDFYNWLVLGGLKYMIPLETPANWDANDMRRKVYSAALWQMVKLWELNTEFGLEGNPQVVYGSKANPRGWYGGQAFSTSPFILHIPAGTGIGNGSANAYSYIDFAWYQLQAVLNDGQGTQIDHEPFDYGYIDGAIRALSMDSGNGKTPEAMLQMFWIVKALQEETLTGAGPQTSTGWHPPPPQVLVDFNYFPIWTGVSPSLRTTVIQAYTQYWFAQATQYTAQQYYAGGWAKANLDPTTVSFETNFGGEVWFMLPRLVYFGIDKTLVAKIGAWASTIWTSADWNMDVNATCSDGNNCTSGY